MAGEGPDVFIIGNRTVLNVGEDALFPIPEKSMAAGVFLPLDEYIENNAQITDWDNQIEPIMAAGRTEEGQVVVPLSYTFPITCYRRSEVPNTYTADTTWEDMLADESGVLRAAGTWYHSSSMDFDSWQGDYLEIVLGELADFQTEELSFTEEELLLRATQILELKNWKNEADRSLFFDHYQLCLYPGYDAFVEYNERNAVKRYEDLTMVPLYSDDGGVTATIVGYAAVNANTNRPADAFFVLDHLMSTSVQRMSISYGLLLDHAAVPVQSDILIDRRPGYRVQGWGFSEANFEEYCRVREQITNVQFQSLLTQELDDFYGKLQMAETNGQDPAQLAAEAYAAMERALKE